MSTPENEPARPERTETGQSREGNIGSVPEAEGKLPWEIQDTRGYLREQSALVTRDRERAEDLLEKIKAASPDAFLNEEELNEERRKFALEFEIRSAERNKNRPWYRKFWDTFTKKPDLTGLDIAQEEGIRLHADAVRGIRNDSKMKAMSIQQATDYLASGPTPDDKHVYGHKTPSHIQYEESMRNDGLQKRAEDYDRQYLRNNKAGEEP